jgi:hypothetical protein
VRDEIDYISFYDALRTGAWAEIVDPITALRHTDTLGFSTESQLPSYIRLARVFDELLPKLPPLVERQRENGWPDMANFNTYLGREWGVPILCALVSGIETGAASQVWDKRFMEWQNRDTYPPMIAPIFGLNQDHDRFLMGMAAPFLTLCAAAAGGRANFPRQMVSVLVGILERIDVSWRGLHLAIWLSHLAARCRLRDAFGVATRYLQQVGGAVRDDLLAPPAFVAVEDASRQDYFDDGQPHLIPDVESFAAAARARYPVPSLPRHHLALCALDDDRFLREWTEAILSNLWRDEA